MQRKRNSVPNPLFFLGAVAGCIALSTSFVAAQSIIGTSHYVKFKQVADVPGRAPTLDHELVNPWGVAFSPSGPFWVSDQGTSRTTLYDGFGDRQGLVVKIPGGGGAASGPTGQVFNGNSAAFKVTEGSNTGSAFFIFVGLDGGISGWSPSVDATNAVLAVDNSGKSAYTGCEIVTGTSGPVLLAADFRGGGLEEYDSSFNWVATLRPPNLSPDWFAFNVKSIGGRIYVTYAQHDPVTHREGIGPGLGLIYTLDISTGKFTRFVTGVHLNAPWGMAISSAGNFGSHSGDLLVGNFGDGKINCYNAATGAFTGALLEPGGQPVQVDGLWSLEFGNGTGSGPSDWLYYSAGVGHEGHGEFGFFEAR